MKARQVMLLLFSVASLLLLCTACTDKPPVEEPAITTTTKETITANEEATTTATEKNVISTKETTATSTAKLTTTSTAKPTATSTAKPIATSTAKPTATSTAKPTAMTTDKPTAMTTDKPSTAKKTTTTKTAVKTTVPTAKKTTIKKTKTTTKLNKTKPTTTSTTTITTTYYPTGYRSTTATPESSQFIEKITDSAAPKEEIIIFYLDEKPFDQLVLDASVTEFLYTDKKSYTHDGGIFYRGLVSPFQVIPKLVDFVGNPSEIERFLQENNLNAKVTYASLIYTQFVQVTLYVRTTDAVYFVTVDEEDFYSHAAGCYITCGYRYTLYTPAEFATFVQESREESVFW